MKIQLPHKYEDIISVENFLLAWKEFLSGKRSKPDVQDFGCFLMDHIMELHAELAAGTYRHGPYHAFHICDPKPRHIHKATVRDRLLHHAVYRILYQFFDRTFIADSYSCRLEKGTHKAMDRFRYFHRRVSRNNTRTCWVLKCDIRKFFASIDHETLFGVLRQYISDERIVGLIREVVGSFYSVRPGVGLPLGNLTSQLLVNIYMNEFDQFVKHRLKAKFYIRYADDFVFLSPDNDQLAVVLAEVDLFLRHRLRLQLHPKKVFLKTLASGVDFLGWVHFPKHRILRNASKRRMLKHIGENTSDGSIASYVGLLRHGQTNKLKKRLFAQVVMGR